MKNVCRKNSTDFLNLFHNFTTSPQTYILVGFSGKILHFCSFFIPGTKIMPVISAIYTGTEFAYYYAGITEKRKNPKIINQEEIK